MGLGCARTRRHQPFKPELPLKREDTPTAAERYRKIPLVGGDLLQVHEHDVVNGGGTLEDLPQVFLVASVTPRQVVRGFLCVAVRRVVTVVRGHMPEAMEDFQCFCVIYNVHTFADVLFRHAVMVLEERDVAVAHDRCRPALFHLVAYGGQRTQIVGFRTFEKFASEVLVRGHAGGVELFQRIPYGTVQGIKASECQPFDVDVDGTVHQPDRIFHESLVLGTARTGWVYGASVMFGESLKLFIDDRLVAVAAGDGGFKVVRHYGHWSTIEEMQRVLTGADKVFLAPGPHGFAISVVAAWQDGNEHLSQPGASREPVSHLKPVTRETDVHLVSYNVPHVRLPLSEACTAGAGCRNSRDGNRPDAVDSIPRRACGP